MIEIEEPELDVNDLASVMREEAMSRKIAAQPGAMQRPAPSSPRVGIIRPGGQLTNAHP